MYPWDGNNPAQLGLLARSEERNANSEERSAKSGFSATAFILAGGRSSRMGADKALLDFGHQNLLQRALQTASGVTEKAYIVGPRARYGNFGEVVEDLYSGCGPLGGIHAALTATSTDLNLILSVDMPLMTADFLCWLRDQAALSEHWIVVPDIAGGLQPLCATYRRGVVDIAERLLQAGDYKIDRLFARVPTRIVDQQQIGAAGFSSNIFQNINTPEEYEQCRR